MNYEEAVAYIEEIPKFTKKNKLSHTKECLEKLGNPQEDFAVIHVAGSNGKGSTCAFLESMLRTAGYHTGLFISPHLVKINERFCVGGQQVTDQEFLWAFQKVLGVAKDMVEAGSYHPTYFEFLFLMGMILFSKKEVQIAVLETGLGGKLDATNVVEHPLVCVITSISLEHTEYLGDTLAAIAGEKAGIVKPGVPVVCDGSIEEVAAVIANRAEEAESKCISVKPDWWEITKTTEDSIAFSYRRDYYDTNCFTIPFVAPYQVGNAVLALEALRCVAKGFPVSAQDAKKGLARVHWEGRMETLLPGVIADGAHNADGIMRFIETAKQFQKTHRIHLLFSAVVEKDYPAMIQEICESLTLEQVVTTTVGGARMVPAEELAQLFRQNGCKHVVACEQVTEAFDQAYKEKKEGLLFCVGSLYLIGEIKSYLIEKKETHQ